MPFSVRKVSKISFAFCGARTTNSLKVGAEKGIEKPSSEILETIRTENGIVGGLALSKYYAGNKNDFLVCVTETNTKAQIDSLVEGLREV